MLTGYYIHSWKLALWQVKVVMYRFPFTEMKLRVFWLERLLGSEDTGSLVKSHTVCIVWSMARITRSTVHWVEMHVVPRECPRHRRTWILPYAAPSYLSWNQPSRIWNPVQISSCCYAVECRKGKRGEGSPLAMLLYPFQYQDWFSKTIFLHASRHLNNVTLSQVLSFHSKSF